MLAFFLPTVVIVFSKSILRLGECSPGGWFILGVPVVNARFDLGDVWHRGAQTNLGIPSAPPDRNPVLSCPAVALERSCWADQ